MMQISLFLAQFLSKFWGALTFYTALPIPQSWSIAFDDIASFAPLVGVLIGGCLGLCTGGLNYLGMPILTSSAVIVGLWILITGGLHLDGVMDTADGLAVTDGDRRLEVMADSKTGAFGVMAGVVVILVKFAAIYDINQQLSNQINSQITYLLLMMAACGWGRWGQLLAIWRYPYLRSQGKGAFHKEAITSIQDLVPSTLLLSGLAIAQIIIHPQQWILAILIFTMGAAIAFLVGAWFNHKLSGHTGDTYGAVVEWTEALLLCVLTVALKYSY
jgi:adenosylcobinamide-GDP ribazoletransferase